MWSPILSEQALHSIFDESNEHPVLIFKHSKRCPLSSMMKRRFETDASMLKQLPTYLLDLVEYRALSDLIASETGIRHESPQLILLFKGEGVFNASHGDIDAKSVSQRLLVL